VRGCEIGKLECRALKKVLDEGIQSLDLSYNPIADSLVELLAGTHLREANFSGCQLSEKSIQAICNSIKSFESLKLRDNSLSEEHCKQLAKYLPEATSLAYFDISLNFIKDEGACWILSSTGHIQHVILAQNQITGKCALTIHQILKARSGYTKKVIDLTRNDLDRSGKILESLASDELVIIMD